MLGDVNKLFVLESFLTMPSNVLPLHLKQNFPLIIWIFTEGEGDGIKSRLLFKIFSTLRNKSAQLSFLQHKILPYQPVMRNICGLLHQIQYRKAHGCFLLDFIYKASCSGVANVREAMQRMLHECHKVSKKFKQCSNSSNFQRTSYQVHLRSIRI